MSDPAAGAKKPVDEVRELASKIYVELVARGADITESSVKMAASPENLAKLSFRFAEVFYGTELELDAARKPKTKFTLDASNIAEWSK
ncbi:MAG TPA: hypothetical protein VEC19_15545 [Usitatibacter sp.]|nr:hypothetical protein [Usitatibacter sp.]